MKKRILSFVLVLSLISNLIISFPITANAETIASGTCGDNLAWILDAEGLLTISGTGDMIDFSIEGLPWQRGLVKNVIIEHGITSIGQNAFYACSNILRVSISNTVIDIGNSAFDYCYKLTNIVLPSSIQEIGNRAFSDCYSLKSISMPDGIKYIGEYAFYNCFELSSVTIPDSVTCIERSTFEDCADLTNVTIYQGTTNISPCAFDGCSNLSDVYYRGSKTEWNKITIDSGNSCLTNAAIHYNSFETLIDNIKLGDYVQMGKYYGKPMLWRCVAFEKISGYDDNGNPIMDATNTVTGYKKRLFTFVFI